MADPKTVSVSILDKEYQVACEEDEITALQQSALYLDKKMREMKDASSVIGLDRLAVMAALNITNDLLAQSVKAEKLAEQQKEIESLNSKIESALDRLKQ